MAKNKQLKSGFVLPGIAPNILLKHVESTAPFLFQGELDTTGELRAYQDKLRFYKKNLKALNHINLTEYFYICMAAHWSTAGTFVPTVSFREKQWFCTRKRMKRSKSVAEKKKNYKKMW